MKLRTVVVLGLLALTAAGGASAGNEAPTTVRLEIDSAYAANGRFGEHGLVVGWFPVDRVFLPFRPLARKFLDHAGARLVRGDTAEAVLHIEVLGTAQGRLYDFMEDWQRLRRFRFIGARLQGRVTLTTTGGATCEARFAGEVKARKGIPIIIARDHREAPQLAPFDKALVLPGSFVAALAAVVGAVYGPKALLSASHDDDTAIARDAATALGPDAVAAACRLD